MDETTLNALTEMQEALTDHGQLLRRLEARPALDMQTLARLVSEELRTQFRPAQPIQRQRAAWRTPLYLTVTALLVALLTLQVVAWQMRSQHAETVQVQPLLPTKAPQPQRKGK